MLVSVLSICLCISNLPASALLLLKMLLSYGRKIWAVCYVGLVGGDEVMFRNVTLDENGRLDRPRAGKLLISANCMGCYISNYPDKRAVWTLLLHTMCWRNVGRGDEMWEPAWSNVRAPTPCDTKAGSENLFLFPVPA